MAKWIVMTALLLMMGVAMPAWAGDREDCSWSVSLTKLPYTNSDRVVAACQRLAEKGEAVAEFNLGRLYYAGQGVRQDDYEAAKWWRKAAEQGNAAAQTDLGIMYGLGQGVQKDYAESLMWSRRAAEQGIAQAQYNVGMLYYMGRGVSKDYVVAYMWLALADQGGVPAANFRDGVAKVMTSAQIARAQALAAAWKPTTGQ